MTRRRDWSVPALAAVAAVVAALCLSLVLIFGAAVADAAEPAAAEAAAGPADGTVVRMRAGEHPGFSRLVFDWTAAVPYELSRAGDVVTLRFAAAGRLDLAPALALRPLRVRAAETAVWERGVAVRITLPPGAGLHDFRTGTKIVLDILDPAAAAEPPPATPPAAPEAAAPPPAPTAAAAPEAAAPTAAATAPAPAVAPAAPAPAASPQPAGRSAAAEPAEAPLQLLPPAPPAASPPTEAAARVAEPPPAEVAVPAPTAPSPADGALTLVQVVADEDGAVLRIPWTEPVAAAAFRRGGAVWLVFDRPAAFDLREVVAAGHPALGTVTQPANTVAVLRLAGAAAPRLSRDGADWLVDFRAQSERPDVAIPQRVEMRAPGGARLVLETERPAAAVELVDPELGDRLLVTPVLGLGEGVAEGRDWPDFRLLATVQGIAVAPRGDGVALRAETYAVIVGRLGGLLISDGAADYAAADSALETGAARPRLFDLPAWRGEGIAGFAATRQALQRAVAEAPAERQNLARLDLARFYFAHGLAAEAVGLLEVTRGADGGGDPEEMLLSGASQLLQGDLKTAAAELGNAALDNESEAVLWRAALAASLGEWVPAAERFARTIDLVDDYPKVVRSRLRLWGAEAQIEAGDPVGALDYLDRLRADAPTADEAAQIEYLEGQRTAREGRFIEARDIWQRLTENAHQPTRARAIFGITEIMLKNGEIDTRAAIDRLERLRFLWRGGPFELALLRRLGQLYLAADDARAGLAALRQAAANFPASGEAPAIAEEMSAAFRRLYLDGAADALSALTAVALFEEFRELTPAGADGDHMIAALADRLVRVDLLDRAGALLADQVAHRLAGVDKARAGARLAAIRLLDRSPELALEALAAGPADDLPTDLVDERRRLQARALFDLGREPEALALLDGDTAREAKEMRADMLWRLQEWGAAAAALAELLDDGAAATAGAEPLDATTAGLVLNRAVALSLIDDREALRALGARYGAAMAGGPLAEPFDVLTADLEGADVTRPIAERLAAAGRLVTFMSDYRARLQTASMSGKS